MKLNVENVTQTKVNLRRIPIENSCVVLENSLLDFYRILTTDNKLSNHTGGYSHMKRSGMLVGSLRGIMKGFWSHLRCRRNIKEIMIKETHLFLSLGSISTGLLSPVYKRRLLSSTAAGNRAYLVYKVSFRGQVKLEPHPDWYPLGL